MTISIMLHVLLLSPQLYPIALWFTIQSQLHFGVLSKGLEIEQIKKGLKLGFQVRHSMANNIFFNITECDTHTLLFRIHFTAVSPIQTIPLTKSSNGKGISNPNYTITFNQIIN